MKKQNLDTLCGFGHPVTAGEDDLPLALQEISICGNAADIKVVAEFLTHVANRMVENADFDHSHLCDHVNQPKLRKRFDIVVCKV